MANNNLTRQGHQRRHDIPLLLAGTANPQLAHKIAEEVGVELGKMEVTRFADGEFDVKIADTVRDRDVFLIQPTCAPVNENYMQLFIILDALRRASASRVHAVVPYFGYSRKEKKTQARDPISAKLMANFIENTGASRLIAVDLHADAIQGFFDIPVDALQATKILAKHCSDTVTHGDLIVVSPDVGGSGRARQLAKMLDVPMAIVDKRRPKDDSIEIVNVIGKVNNKHCIIVDDLISTGSTLIGASNALLNLGASKVDVVATHGVLAGNAKDNLTNSSLNSICITDTIPHEFTDLQKQKFVVVSVAPMIAEAIVRINEGRSVSELFK